MQPLDPATASVAPDRDVAAFGGRAAGGLTDVRWQPYYALILATVTAAKP